MRRPDRPLRTRDPLLATAVLLALAAAPACADDAAKKPAPSSSAVRAPARSVAAETGGAEGRKLSAAEIGYYNQAVTDPEAAAEALVRVRAALERGLDPPFHGFARQVLLRALMTTEGPGEAIVAAADSAASYLPGDPAQRAFFMLSLAQHLAQREIELERAAEFARRAVAYSPPGAGDLRAYAEATLGAVHLKRGDADSAVTLLSRAASATPDSQAALFYLGTAYEKAGKPAPAIDAYVRSLAVFPSADSAAAAPLRALWRKQHGSLKGLDERVRSARSASAKAVALDARRDERPAPEWELTDADGQPVRLADFRGKVLVLDFWGSWCGPCRMELPFFQKLHDKYRGHAKVAVLSVNWEREKTVADKIARAKRYMGELGFDFPVVYDHDQKVALSYRLEGYPTVYMIDPEGRIRYVNTGFTHGIDEIMEAQIASMLP